MLFVVYLFNMLSHITQSVAIVMIYGVIAQYLSQQHNTTYL